MNVTLLSTLEQYQLAAEVYRQAIGAAVKRRRDASFKTRVSKPVRPNGRKEKIMRFPESALSTSSLGSLRCLLRFDYYCQSLIG